jgi:1-acyl-sn-glycerol-3-phosphate acyltransferase
MRRRLFGLLFYGLSVPVVLAAPVPALMGARPLRAWVLMWCRLHRVLARAVLGIRSRVEGAPATGPALYAAKHQAMFETLELCLILGGPAIVLKQELAAIPVWGWAARRYGCIAVDRAGSAAALRGMMREAQAARAAGRSVLIFPEGTRVAPGEAPPLQPGFAGLYRALALPVVPVALDSGRVWPRRGPTRAGVVTIRFGEEVPPGLARREVEGRVHRAVNELES